MNLETGRVVVMARLDCDPESSRSEAAESARRAGGTLTGDPIVIAAKDFNWPAGYEGQADADDLKVIQWTMVRERVGG